MPLQPPWKSSDARAGLLDAGIVCKRHFNHSGSHQILVQGCLDAGNLSKRHFNHGESLQNLVQDCLDIGVMKMYTPRKYGHPGVPIFT